jgi:VWFA-related protein
MQRLVLACMVAAAVAPATPQRTTVEPRPGYLLIDATVDDKGGKFVADLKPDEFEVWVAGYRVPIQSVSIVEPAAEGPSRRSITLLFDDITVDPSITPRMRDVGRQFVTRMAPGDRMAVVMLSGAQVPSTDLRAQLRQAIDKLGPRAVGVMRPDTLAAHVLQTLTAIAGHMSETADRGAIVAIGPAWLFDTPIPPPTIGGDLRPEWTATVRALARANASLYVIDPGGVGRTRVTGGASGFARDTGGFAFTNTNDFPGVADRIMRDTSSYYRLEVQDPPVGRGADLREVDVRVKRRGVTVRARRAIPGA